MIFTFKLGNITLFKCECNLWNLWIDSHGELLNWELYIIDLSESYGCKIHRTRNRYLKELGLVESVDPKDNYSLLRIECKDTGENSMELEFSPDFFDEMIEDISLVTSEIGRTQLYA